MSLLLKMSKSPSLTPSSSVKYLATSSHHRRHVISPPPPRHHPAFPKKFPQFSLSTQPPNNPNFNFSFNFNPNSKSPDFKFNSDKHPPPFQWHSCNNAENGGLNIKRDIHNNNSSNSNSNNNNKVKVTVVVLGWLGAGPRQLRRYVEMYNEKGYNAVTFVVSVREALVLGLGRGLEERVGELAGSLADWAEGGEEDRVVVFHTFSNTGWLAYGAILDNWRGRHDLLMKIKGCIVDSGAEAELDPKVWAAGFVAAVLKKRSSLTSSASASSEIGKQTNSEASFSKTTDEEPLFTESVLMAVFEKLFSFLFSLPDVSGRLRYVLSTLTNDQPLCPQLYLYSTADKVIPFKSVEAFMEKQRKIGREVWSFNFGLSPHVDHYRTFPEIYSTQLLNFLQECLVTVKLS